MLRVRSLEKRYGDRTVLAGVSFEIADGTVTALVGSNGAGKSTLLRCLAGVGTFRGTVERFGGAPVPRGAVAFLPQSPRLPGEATVAEIGALLAGERRDFPAIAGDVRRRARELSGGETQRAALGALIALRPRLLLLDEPTADLDGSARAELLRLLGSLRDSGATVVLTTPAPQAAELSAIADRVIALDGGRVAADLPAADYFAR